jgi:hypothetical protein
MSHSLIVFLQNVILRILIIDFVDLFAQLQNFKVPISQLSFKSL